MNLNLSFECVCVCGECSRVDVSAGTLCVDKPAKHLSSTCFASIALYHTLCSP